MAEQNSPLEMRLTKLENTLSKLVEATKVSEITSDEMKVYTKVRDAIEGDFCGINDCMVLRCLRCAWRCLRCVRCVRCVNECVCGPCSYGGGVGGSFSEIGS